MTARIKIVNRQTADGDTGEIIQAVSGEYEYDNGSFSVSYDENGELTGHTCVTFDGKTVKVKRENSDLNAVMSFAFGERLECLYITPYGEIGLETVTKEIYSAVNENGGVLELFYELYSGSQLQSYNEMRMDIQSEEKDV